MEEKTQSPELREVEIDKSSTCLTYALQRTGLPKFMCTTDTVEEYFDIAELSTLDNGGHLKVGDILMWDLKKKTSFMNQIIDKNGVITAIPVTHGVHFEVYEGNGNVSGCTRVDAIANIPHLRVRRLSDIERLPEKILTLKTKYHAKRTKPND